MVDPKSLTEKPATKVDLCLSLQQIVVMVASTSLAAFPLTAADKTVTEAWHEERQPYGTISTSEPLRRATYATHVWLVANAAGAPLGLFVAGDTEAIPEIGTNTTASNGQLHCTDLKTRKQVSNQITRGAPHERCISVCGQSHQP